MFSNAKKTAVAKVTNDKVTTGTIIGEGIVIEGGSIQGSGNVRIDGKFSGNISLDGHIVVGSTGQVEGEIRACSALFAGVFQGNLFIQDTVHLAPDSEVSGYVEASKMIMDEDAIFNGKCIMTKNSQRDLVELIYTNDNEPEDFDEFEELEAQEESEELYEVKEPS